MRLSQAYLLLPLLLLTCSGMAHGQDAKPDLPVEMPENFSVTMDITNLQGSSQEIQAKIAKLGRKQRTDFTNMPGPAGTALSGQMYVITDIESGESVTVMPTQKMYMTMNLNQMGLGDQNLDQMMKRAEGMNFEKLAEEAVNGVQAVKYKATDPEKGEEYMIWVDPGTKFPVKVHSPAQDVTVLYSDFSAESPEASLFEVPDDYQQLPGLNPDMMKGVMQNMQKQLQE